MPYVDLYEDGNSGATISIKGLGGDDDTGKPGGVEWDGDADNEIIFGTDWLDALSGGGGDDIMYGFEGDDTINGGLGKDRLFGDGGDDTIFVGDAVTIEALPSGPDGVTTT